MTPVPKHAAPTSDSELVAAVARGDLQALGELFDSYAPHVRRYLVRMGVGPGDLDDLVQLTFLELARAAARFDPSLPLRAWLLGLASMLVRRERRSLARAAARCFSWANVFSRKPPPTPHELVEADEALRRLAAALECLSPAKRDVFLLVMVEGLSGEQTARALGIPLNTVWTRLHHARRELCAALEEVRR